MRALALLAALAAAAVAAGAASAHGDPASEYLVGHDVFFPIGHPLSGETQARVSALVAEAARKGYPIRVALIGSRFDLGTEGDAWRRPAVYAKALDADLAYYFAGPLLVAMPNGFGFAHPKHGTGADRALLARVPLRDGLAAAAELAVQRLAAAHGVTLTLPGHLTTPAERNRRDRLVIVAAAVVLLLAGALVRRLRRRRAQPSPQAGG